MIENKEFLVCFVGANCVRPLGLQYAPTGEHSSPLQIITIELALNNNFGIRFWYEKLLMKTGDHWSPYRNNLSNLC